MRAADHWSVNEILQWCRLSVNRKHSPVNSLSNRPKLVVYLPVVHAMHAGDGGGLRAYHIASVLIGLRCNCKVLGDFKHIFVTNGSQTTHFRKCPKLVFRKLVLGANTFYFKHIFVLDMFSMEETPGCSFFKCQASALGQCSTAGVESLWDHAG